MGFLWDLLCVGILVAALLTFIRRPLFSAGVSCAVLALTLVLAFFISTPLSAAVQSLLAPGVERTAANRLADLYSAVHLDSGEETVAQLDFTDMIRENPPAFSEVLDYFGADIEDVRALPQPTDSVQVLHAVTNGYVQALARVLSYAGLFLLFFIAGMLVQRRLELNRPPQPSPKGGKLALSAGLGLVDGIFWVFALGTVLHWLASSVGAHAVLVSDQTLQSASFYQILNRINPFIRL